VYLFASFACPGDPRLDKVGNMEKLVIGFCYFLKLDQQRIITINPLETGR
jgi:hypothetical protein